MSTKELVRLTVIKGAIDGLYTVKQAAKKLGMSNTAGNVPEEGGEGGRRRGGHSRERGAASG